MRAFPALRRPRTSALLLVLVASICSWSLTGCGGSDGGSGSGGTTVTVDIGEPATATSAPATSATTTTATTAAPVGLADPHEAAKRLYDAWKANDKVTAATVAEASAVESMWQTVPGDYALYNKCNTGEFGSSACLYRGDAGTIQFAMEQRGALWVVVEAVFSAA